MNLTQIFIAAAFIAGFLSFVSSHILPLALGYISLMSGLPLEVLWQETRDKNKQILKKTGRSSVFFVVGFSAVFISLGILASHAGKSMAEHMSVFTKTAGTVAIILGAHFIGILKVGLLEYDKRIHLPRISPGFFGAFLLGFTFGFGWTPGLGPILVGILALAAVQQSPIKGAFLLAVYSLGLGIPFIITGFGKKALIHFFRRHKRFIRLGEVVAGLLLIAIGVLIFLIF